MQKRRIAPLKQLSVDTGIVSRNHKKYASRSPNKDGQRDSNPSSSPKSILPKLKLQKAES